MRPNPGIFPVNEGSDLLIAEVRLVTLDSFFGSVVARREHQAAVDGILDWMVMMQAP